MAHELGHLFACHHNRWHPRNEGCPNAWEVVPNFRFTVMSVNAPFNSTHSKTAKIPNFSDPDISWYNYPTGNDVQNDEADCAGQIRSIGCTVAGHKEPVELSAIIEGEGVICSGTETFTVNIEQPPIGKSGQPPYIVEWYWNNDGFFTSSNMGTYIGSGTSITIPPPNIANCSFIFIRSVVTALDGTKGYAVKRISTYPCQNCGEPQAPIPPLSSTNRDILKSKQFHVYPNPTKERIFIASESNSVISGLSIHNPLGQLIHRIPGISQTEYETSLEN